MCVYECKWVKKITCTGSKKTDKQRMVTIFKSIECKRIKILLKKLSNYNNITKMSFT